MKVIFSFFLFFIKYEKYPEVSSFKLSSLTKYVTIDFISISRLSLLINHSSNILNRISLSFISEEVILLINSFIFLLSILRNFVVLYFIGNNSKMQSISFIFTICLNNI